MLSCAHAEWLVGAFTNFPSTPAGPYLSKSARAKLAGLSDWDELLGVNRAAIDENTAGWRWPWASSTSLSTAPFFSKRAPRCAIRTLSPLPTRTPIHPFFVFPPVWGRKAARRAARLNQKKKKSIPGCGEKAPRQIVSQRSYMASHFAPSPKQKLVSLFVLAICIGGEEGLSLDPLCRQKRHGELLF